MDREQQLQHLPARERAAVTRALNAGARYGYGNVIAWLATEWACGTRWAYDADVRRALGLDEPALRFE